MTEDKLREVKEKVRALLMKAADSAATAAEAAGAMAAAQKLMARYQVTADDLNKLSASDYKFMGMAGTHHRKSNSWYLHPVQRYCAPVVGRFCAVKPYTKTHEDGSLSLELFGMDSDVELAAWMLRAFTDQFEHDWEVFKRDGLGTRRLVTIKEARLSFAGAFTKAINERLETWMFRKSDSPAEGTSSGFDLALVKDKMSLIEAELVRRGIYLSAGQHRGRGGSHDGAAAAGYASGSRAETGRGVGGGRIAIGSN
jgi:Protein of unknown function (DUF2786)